MFNTVVVNLYCIPPNKKYQVFGIQSCLIETFDSVLNNQITIFGIQNRVRERFIKKKKEKN